MAAYTFVYVISLFFFLAFKCACGGSEDIFWELFHLMGPRDCTGFEGGTFACRAISLAPPGPCFKVP